MDLSKQIFIARQPILDRKQRIFGYELLFRSGETKNQAHVEDDVLATSRVVINILNDIGTKNLIGAKKGFINVNEKILNKEVLKALPPEHFILEILETTMIYDVLIEKIVGFKDEGYIFALDDFVLNDENINYFGPIFKHMSIIKVDLFGNDHSNLKEKLSFFKKYDVKLLAEKVETEEVFKSCLDAGFEYFQGYYFAKPKIIKGRHIDPKNRTIYELINLLHNDADIGEIEDLFHKTPELTLNVLKFINSAYAGVRNEVNSIKQAISLLGHSKLLSWLLLMNYAKIGNERAGEPILQMASIRAKAMSLIISKLTSGSKHEIEEAFLVGLLSLLDVLFQMPIATVLKDLNVSQEINKAILYGEGIKGIALDLTKLIEKDEIDHIQPILEELKLSSWDILKVMSASYKWALQMQ